MFDIHTHILPDCDDGSPDTETSLEQIILMKEKGVTDILLTPHFMRNSYHNTKDVIDNRFDLLSKALKEKNIQIDLYKAAEVYLDYNILDTIKKEELNIHNTKYVLVETGMTGFPINLKEILYELVRNGWKPIMAHPERYPDVYNNPDIVEDLIHRNVYMQLNAGSIIGKNGEDIQKAAFKLLERGFVHFLASDNHCRSREYTLPIAIELIKERYGKNLAELLTEINPGKVIKDEKIDYFYMEYQPPPEDSFFRKILKKIKK